MSNKPFAIQDGIKFPDGTIQTTAYVEQNIDQHIWIDEISTTAADDPETDRIRAVSSVEYDSQNNIIALAVHALDADPDPSATYSTISKFTPLGNIVWQIRFQNNLNTDGWGVAVGNDDEIYIVGTHEDGGQVKTFVKKYNSDGSEEWFKQIDFDGLSSYSFVIDVAPNDGNVVLTGYYNQADDNGDETFTAKIDSSTGDVIWIKSLQGVGDEYAFGLGVGADGAIVIVGLVDFNEAEIYNTANSLWCATSFDSLWDTPATGVVLDGITFDVTFGLGGYPTFTNIVDTVGSRHHNDIIGTIDNSLISTDPLANNLIVRINGIDNLQPSRMLVTKYNSFGTLAWQRALEYDEGMDATGADADIDSLGNIYVCLQYDYVGIGGGTAMAITKFDSAGTALWTRRLNGNCSSFASSVVVGPDDHLYIAAMTGNDETSDFSLVIAKYELNGQLVWQRLLDNTTTWTMTGNWWNGPNSGSCLDVRDGYFVVGGTIADPFVNYTNPKGLLAQFSTDGEQLEIGNYLYTQSNLSGLLTSPYRVINNINKDDVDISGLISVSDITGYGNDPSILTVNKFGLTGTASSLITSPSGEYHLRVTDDGSIVLPDGSEQTSAFVDAPSGPLPDFLTFEDRGDLDYVNNLYGWTGNGLWFQGSAGSGASYPVFTDFTIPGNTKVVVTVDFVYNEDCNDPSICIFTDGVIPEWSWDSNPSRIAASYDCPDPHIYGLAGTVTNYSDGGGPIVPNRTYTARLTYDPNLGGDWVKLETLNSMGEIIDTLLLDEKLPNSPYRIGFAADQDTVGGDVGGENSGLPVKTYFKNLNIDIDNGATTHADTLQGYNSVGYMNTLVKFARGSEIHERNDSLVLTPMGAIHGQELVIRPTVGVFSISTDHPSGFVPGESITITTTDTIGTGTGTLDYTFTGATAGQLGRATTGTMTFNVQSSQTVTWTIPALSSMTTFTFTIISGTGFGGVTGLPVAITVTLDGSAVTENNHIHLISGDPTTTDLYLGDDDQYVKIDHSGNVSMHSRDNTGGTGATITLYGAGGEGEGSNTSATSGDIDIVAGVDGGYEFDNSVSGDLGNIRLKTKSYTGQSENVWKFGNDGKLTAPGNLQVDGGRIILNTGDNAYVESVDYGVNSANSAVNIFGGPYQKINLRAGYGTQATWTFGTDGTLTLPAGGDIVDSTGASVLGGSVGIGINQTWQDMTSVRAFDTVYTNSTSLPIMVSAGGVGGNTGQLRVFVGVSSADVLLSLGATNSGYTMFSFVVPPGHKYKITTNNSYNGGLVNWAELR